MANTALILPQWLLPKEPGMKCRPHGTIIGMLVVYNIISTVVSDLLAGPFFFRQKQRLWSWKRRTLDRFLPCFTCGPRREDLPPNELSFWPFIISVLGSIALALSAPLLAGLTISHNHTNINRWVFDRTMVHPPASHHFHGLHKLLPRPSPARNRLCYPATKRQLFRVCSNRNIHRILHQFFQHQIPAGPNEYQVSYRLPDKYTVHNTWDGGWRGE